MLPPRSPVWLPKSKRSPSAGLLSGTKRKRTGRDACPTKSSKLRLLGGFGLESVVGQGEARFVAVGGVFVEHALGDGLVDGGHRGMDEIARSGGVSGGDGGAQTAHQRA